MKVLEEIEETHGAPYYLSTFANESTPHIRWIASLSNGLTIYQTNNNELLEIPSAWLRLKQYCADKSVAITQLRLQYRTHMIIMASHADGYFFANRIRVMMNVINSYQDQAIGIGYLDKNILNISWFNDNGLVEQESRNITGSPKHGIISLIKN